MSVSSFETLQIGGPGVVAIGTFDGVHLGHQRLLLAARAQAREAGHAFIIVTLDPAPQIVLRGLVNFQITDGSVKRVLLEGLEPDALVMLPFTLEFAALGSGEFLDRLERHIRVSDLWMGDDFRFGREREGGISSVLERAHRSGYAVHVLSRQASGTLAERVSSSAIREALWAGSVEGASTLLGHPFDLQGEVIHGAGRGRQLGYPTANLALQPEQIVPLDGVYAAQAFIEGDSWATAVSVGTNPHFDGEMTTVEAYVLDFDQDIYGQVLRLSFSRRLRGQERYGTLEGLLEQIALDVEQTRHIIVPHTDVPHTVGATEGENGGL